MFSQEVEEKSKFTEVAASIGYALEMSADEREKRHQFNFKHVEKNQISQKNQPAS